MTVCINPTAGQHRVSKSFDTLRALFNGENVKEAYNNNKERKVGNTIKEAYGDIYNNAFAEKMFNEIVYRATYKPAMAHFEGFTPGDFRRISNEIKKESNRLKSGNLNILEKALFVKRATMGKFAVTRWMNTKLTEATNYERTQYSRYLTDHMGISKLLRTEVLSRDGQSKFRPGIKAMKDLEKIEKINENSRNWRR